MFPSGKKYFWQLQMKHLIKSILALNYLLHSWEIISSIFRFLNAHLKIISYLTTVKRPFFYSVSLHIQLQIYTYIYYLYRTMNKLKPNVLPLKQLLVHLN